MIDVSAFVGYYPYRWIERTGPEDLLAEMDRAGIERAWVGDLSSFLYRDPRPANRELALALNPHADRLHPVPTIHPGLPGWIEDISEAVGIGAPAIRVYPMHQGLKPDGVEMKELVCAAGEAGLALLLTVKFEDVRQRHPLDNAPDLPPSSVRTLARESDPALIVVTHAGREFVEEVHFGLTPGEAERVLYDIGWIWGPPSNDLDQLISTVGHQRFVVGTGMPLRIPEAVGAKLDLSSISSQQRAAIESGNLDSRPHSNPLNSRDP